MMEPVDFDSTAGFGRAVRAAVDAALARSTRTLLCVDRDFAAWPLDDPALLDALTGYLRRPGRRLILLAEGFERMERLHPRFTQWRPNWSHAVEPRCPEMRPPDGLETLLLDDGPTVLEARVTDLSTYPPKGRAQQDAAVAAAARDRIDAWLQRSVPDWPVRPLGL
jgi:hypothetical protein